MKLYTINDVMDSSLEKRVQIRNEMIVAKMQMDKWFSAFLEDNELEEENTDTPAWNTYREHLRQYDQVSTLLKSIDYYIQHA